MKCLFVVRQLLNGGVSPDLVNEDGLTALHQVHNVWAGSPSAQLGVLFA